MIEYWKATLRVLGVVVLISELLLTSEGKVSQFVVVNYRQPFLA